MVIEKTPFRKYSLNENKRDRVITNLKEEDRRMLEAAKWSLNLDMDSTVLMILARAGWNGIQHNFSAKDLHYLTNGERVRVMRKKPEFLEIGT